MVMACVGEQGFPEQAEGCVERWHEPRVLSRPRPSWVGTITLNGQRPTKLPPGAQWTTLLPGKRYSRQMSLMRMITAAWAFVDAKPPRLLGVWV